MNPDRQCNAKGWRVVPLGVAPGSHGGRCHALTFAR
jgi:hypothetical protein